MVFQFNSSYVDVDVLSAFHVETSTFSPFNFVHSHFIVWDITPVKGFLQLISCTHHAKISFAKINPVNGKSTFAGAFTSNESERNWYANFQVSTEKVIISVPIYLRSSIRLHCAALLSRVSVFNNELQFGVPSLSHTHPPFCRQMRLLRWIETCWREGEIKT